MAGKSLLARESIPLGTEYVWIKFLDPEVSKNEFGSKVESYLEVPLCRWMRGSGAHILERQQVQWPHDLYLTY